MTTATPSTSSRIGTDGRCGVGSGPAINQVYKHPARMKWTCTRLNGRMHHHRTINGVKYSAAIPPRSRMSARWRKIQSKPETCGFVLRDSSGVGEYGRGAQEDIPPVPDPKLVSSVRDCGTCGGVFGKSYASRGAVKDVIPVDHTVKGCPPAPAAIL